MGLTVEQIRRAQSVGGRAGAARKLLLHGRPHRDEIKAAQRAYRASFEVAHGGDPRAEPWASMRKADRPIGLCRLCPKRIDVPDLPPDERAEFVDLLRRQHFIALAARAVQRRRTTG